jgi:hypothetical protein
VQYDVYVPTFGRNVGTNALQYTRGAQIPDSNVLMATRFCTLAPFEGIRRGTGLESKGDRLLKPCYLSRDDHNWKIRTRKQRTDVGKYAFVNRTIKSWKQLPAGLLASFPCKLNTFRERVSYKQGSSSGD